MSSRITSDDNNKKKKEKEKKKKTKWQSTTMSSQILGRDKERQAGDKKMRMMKTKRDYLQANITDTIRRQVEARAVVTDKQTGKAKRKRKHNGRLGKKGLF